MAQTDKDPTSWLNSKLFQKALVHHTTDRSLEVEDVHLALQGTAGRQYASTIYRACVSYRSRGKAEVANLIVKLVSSKVNSVADESSFDAELTVYRDYLSKMKTIIGENAAAHFGPKLIYAASDPAPYLILEDLTSRHYAHSNKLLGFDDAKVILSKLAQFHAASYNLSSSVNYSGMFNNGLFKPKPSEGVQFMLENFGIFTEELSKWDGYSKFAERLKNMQPSFMQRGTAVYGTSGFEFNVLNHGDLHYNNMLFNFDYDQRVQDVVFYDFQLSCWTTPSVDLLYFLYLICDRETRDSHRQQLVQFYHQELTRTLSDIGHLGKVPTLLDINTDLLRAGFLEVIIAICFVPFLFADYDQAMNVYGNDEDARAYRRRLYSNEEYQEIIKPLLPHFLYKGLLA